MSKMGKVEQGRYKGPYLRGTDGINGTAIPKNPLVDPSDSVIEHHWNYNPSTGQVQPMSLPPGSKMRYRQR